MKFYRVLVYFWVAGAFALGGCGFKLNLPPNATGSAAQLVFATNPALTGTPGTALATQPVVQIEDANGNVVSSATSAVSMSLFSDSACGTPASPSVISVSKSASSGIAAFNGYTINTDGSYYYKATMSGLTSTKCSSSPIVISGSTGTAALLAWTTQPSLTSPAGVALSTQPVIQVEDQYGNVVSSATNSVSMSLFSDSACGAAVSPSTANNPQSASSGVATFSGYAIEASGTYYYEATASGLTSTACSASSIVIGATYYLSATGSDTNDGLTSSTPWLTPNHAVNCGDVIIAAPSTDYLQANFGWGSFGTVSCPAGNNVAWLKCATFDGCKISVPSNAPPYAGGINIDQSYWGVQGWEVDSNNGDEACFQFGPAGAGYPVHHNIFANDIAVGCGQGGFQGSPNAPTGYDYWAVVGCIAYNAAQDSNECYSGFDAYGPVASDSVPGTHIYIAGNFGWGNVNPNPCGGGQPTDGDGVILDTFQNGSYNYPQQTVIENNILIFNGGRGIHAYLNAGSPSGSDYIVNNTTYGNDQGDDEDISCAEIAVQASLSTAVYGNLSETASGLTCYGGANDYVFSVSQTINSSDQVYDNFGYSAAGYDTTGSGTGFSWGPDNTFSDPLFANPVEPGAPDCSGYANVPDCMATVIADFTPANPSATSYGYQIPSSTYSADSLFPSWLCNVNLPDGLVSNHCQ